MTTEEQDRFWQWRIQEKERQIKEIQAEIASLAWAREHYEPETSQEKE